MTKTGLRDDTTLGAIRSQWWAASDWNGARNMLGIPGRLHRNPHSNPVERAIRPVTLGRKSALFAGSDGGAGRWAIVASLIETAKLNGVEPYAWLRDVLSRMVDGHPQQHL